MLSAPYYYAGIVEQEKRYCIRVGPEDILPKSPHRKEFFEYDLAENISYLYLCAYSVLFKLKRCY